MAINTYPAPAVQQQPANTSSLVFGGSTSTGNYTYTGTIPAGTYILSVTAQGIATYNYAGGVNPSATAYNVPNGINSFVKFTSNETSFNVSMNQSVGIATGPYPAYSISTINSANGYIWYLGFKNSSAYPVIYYGTNGNTAALAYDTNATTWQSTVQYGIKYTGGLYVGFAPNPAQLSYSATPGSGWTSAAISSATARAGSMVSIAGNGTNWVIANWAGSSTVFYSSTTGITGSYTGRTLSGWTYGGAVEWHSAGSVFVAGDNNGNLASSPTGVTWTARTSGVSGASAFQIISNGTVCLAYFGRLNGATFDYAYSTNGTTWTVGNWNNTYQTVGGLAYFFTDTANKIWAIASPNGSVYNSYYISTTDCVTWTYTYLPFISTWTIQSGTYAKNWAWAAVTSTNLPIFYMNPASNPTSALYSATNAIGNISLYNYAPQSTLN